MKTKTKKETLENIIKRTEYYYVNSDLTTTNFPIPEKIETEGWKLIRMGKSFSSQEASDKIKAEGCRPANAYELALWLENHRSELKSSEWCLAFGQLWLDSLGHRRVPYVHAHRDGDFGFGLGSFVGGWGSGGVLLCFCDLPQSSDTLPLKTDVDPLTLSALETRISAIENWIRNVKDQLL